MTKTTGLNRCPMPRFQDLANWWGDRGEPIRRSYVIEWCVEGDYLYMHWSEKAPSHLTPEYEDSINWFNWRSLIWEVEDECLYVNSIFNQVSE